MFIPNADSDLRWMLGGADFGLRTRKTTWLTRVLLSFGMLPIIPAFTTKPLPTDSLSGSLPDVDENLYSKQRLSERSCTTSLIDPNPSSWTCHAAEACSTDATEARGNLNAHPFTMSGSDVDVRRFANSRLEDRASKTAEILYVASSHYAHVARESVQSRR